MTALSPFAGRWRLALLLALIGLAILLSGLSPAAAHGYIVRAIPADRAVLDRSPTRIQAWFSEGLEPRFSSLSLADARGEAIALVDSGVVPTNPAQLSARIPEPLPDGLYVVTMRVAFASDGHVFNERLTFWVGQPSGEVALGPEGRYADPLEIVWRAITLPALAVLFGAGVVYQTVFIPGWGNPRYRAGRLTPRVMNRLSLVAWIAVIMAGVGTVLAVLQQSAALFGVEPGAVIRDGLWQVVLDGTQIGDTLRARFVMIGLSAALLFGAVYVRERVPVLVGALWITLIMTAAGALGTISLSSHAAGADLWLLPSILVHWTHTLATAAWAGGLVVLVAVLPAALGPLDQGARRAALMAALRRFSALGVFTLVVLGATGIYNAGIQVREPSQMWTTDYGLTLAAKLLLIIPLLLIAAYHHALASNDRLARWLAPLLARLRPGEAARTLRAESIMGVAVLVATAALAATPPPIPAEAGTGAELPSQTAHLDEMSNLAVAVAVDPGAPGANFYEVTITRAGDPISGAQVWLRLVLPALDWRSRPMALDDTGSGLYVGVGTEFDRAGRWQMQVDVLLPGMPPEQAGRAAFWWELPDAPPALFVREPTLFNWLGAGLIAAAFGALLGPGVVRRIRALHLQPEAVAVGVVALVATLVILALGGVALANSLAELDARRNPPPPFINPTLADAESLALGRMVFEAHCAECHGPPSTGFIQVPAGNPPSLRTLVGTRRDAAIYETITRGRGEMPPIDIPESDRWAVINYLRGPAFHADAPGTGD